MLKKFLSKGNTVIPNYIDDKSMHVLCTNCDNYFQWGKQKNTPKDAVFVKMLCHICKIKTNKIIMSYEYFDNKGTLLSISEYPC